MAYGITVPSPWAGKLIGRHSAATLPAISVDDAGSCRPAAFPTGRLLLCPEGAACLTAARHLRAGGWIRAGERVVVLNTGAGVKYPETVDVTGIPVLAA